MVLGFWVPISSPYFTKLGSSFFRSPQYVRIWICLLFQMSVIQMVPALTIYFLFFQFRILLKERVCSLVIKLFSPNIKYKMNAGGGSGGGSSMQNMPMQEKPSYAITSKLLRVVAVLIVQVAFVRKK